MTPRAWVRAGAGAVLVLLAVGPFAGAPLSAREAWRALLAGPGEGLARVVFWDLRVPRVLLGALVGAAAAAAGMTTQAVTRNVLGTPSILGLNAGASLALVVAQVAGWEVGGTGRVGLAFAGAAFAGGLVLAAGIAMRGGDPGLRLALAGACLTMAMTSVLVVLARRYDLFPDLVLLEVGSLGHATWLDVARTVAPVLLGLAGCALLAPRLAVGLLSPEAAAALGLSRRRLVLLAGLSVLVLQGGVVAAAGPIAFVDVLVPVLLRARLGSDPRALLWPTVLGGAATVLVADLLARAAAIFAEVPTGLFTAVLGLPAFLWVAARGSR